MSAKMSKERRLRRKTRSWRCPKCKSREKQTKEYPAEGVLLHICKRCSFPQRVKAEL